MQRKNFNKNSYPPSPFDPIWRSIDTKDYEKALIELGKINLDLSNKDDWWIAYARCKLEQVVQGKTSSYSLKIIGDNKKNFLLNSVLKALHNVCNKRRLDYLRLKVRCHQELEQFPEAWKILVYIRKREPYSRNTMFAFGYFYQAAKDFGAALDVYSKWLEKHPDDFQVQKSKKICSNDLYLSDYFQAQLPQENIESKELTTQAIEPESKPSELEPKPAPVYFYEVSNYPTFFNRICRAEILPQLIKKNPRYVEDYLKIKKKI